jgi:c-di-GMP-binding flagellar brake protein YcgR
MTEKRRFPRLAVNAEVEYAELTSEPVRTVTSASKNIGAGGVCIIAFKSILPGTALSLKFPIAQLREIVLAQARVVWCSPMRLSGVAAEDVFEVGLEFIEISEKDREKINRYVLSKQTTTH